MNKRNNIKNHRKINRRVRWNRVLFLPAIFCLIMSCAINAFADSAEEYNCLTVVVHSGDTMWDLLQEYNPEYNGDMNEAIYKTCKLNDMDSAVVRVGQSILIPRLP